MDTVHARFRRERDKDDRHLNCAVAASGRDRDEPDRKPQPRGPYRDNPNVVVCGTCRGLREYLGESCTGCGGLGYQSI